MLRNLSVCIGALVAVLLFSSDSSACFFRGRTCGCSGNGYYGASYGYGYDSGYGYGSGYYYGSGYDSGSGYGRGYGRSGYNPGGIGGPASGLGVRPGAGFGGFGPRR